MLTGHKLVGPQPLALQEVTKNKLATLEVENIGSENAHSDLEWFRVTAKRQSTIEFMFNCFWGLHVGNPGSDPHRRPAEGFLRRCVSVRVGGPDRQSWLVGARGNRHQKSKFYN
jgi:hypothetical protein